ncbi:hypothetical protein SMI01S_11720 [Sphingobacterium mizutaii NBRC 14946 = DSM 11724]|uniref:Uncharacterized protein n=2 Tax=Sphingobacterium mizutaii TaxID=1010 RepID=A0AAJ4XCV8_9SPHI|nr:hypothetical protein [Sphingobacterium mizutaii]GEM67566.1 hypothetical protein SMI01S_11720 [Sphingobacterium mizutaii NBRC 14946 = DSM 11724]SDL14348.1 hypothetical protein SAMN05192578_1011506 [Sphingobacterium mizutaii]SNV52120.1 Uncharacterised protein [Sphingobacterium mizutaii]
MEDLTKNKKDSKNADTAKQLDIEKQPSTNLNQETDLEKELKKELDSYKKENADLHRMLEGKEVEVEDLRDSLDSKELLVKDLEEALKVANEAIENSKVIIEEFENAFLNKSGLNSSKPIESTDIIAVKGDQERTFPKPAWDSLPADKNGWQIKVETPEEAK